MFFFLRDFETAAGGLLNPADFETASDGLLNQRDGQSTVT
jgi:hypothetical protein